MGRPRLPRWILQISPGTKSRFTWENGGQPQSFVRFSDRNVLKHAEGQRAAHNKIIERRRLFSF